MQFYKKQYIVEIDRIGDHMKALITGASSGMGRDMARILSLKGYDLILVARSKEKLEQLKEELTTNVEIYPLDLSSTFHCNKLYNKLKKEDIEIVINNAGFGLFGEFHKTSLEKELDMIDLNIKATHTLTKLFLKDFIKKDCGYILNVASSAGLMKGGPLMATYYATKSYLVAMTNAIYEELRKMGSNVYIGSFCPGPVHTNFNQVAGVRFELKGLESYDAASYAISKMFQRKMMIVPGFSMKMGVFLSRFLSTKQLLKITYHIQHKKGS